MSDILRTISQFNAFIGAVEDVWLVEAGEALREKQKDTLCGSGSSLIKKDENGKVWWEAKSHFGNVTVKWIEDVVMLPGQTHQNMPFVVAHEFFDALPIHAFESVAPAPEPEKTQLLDTNGQPMVRPSRATKEPQWRELLVAPTKRKLPFFDAAPKSAEAVASKEPDPEFGLTLAHASSPTSMLLPERPRYRSLKATPGSRIEVSADSARYVGAIANLIGQHVSKDGPEKQNQPAGAALVIDYGPTSTVPINSFRGIRSHKIVSPFVYPGKADLSADVDFTALADAALEASPKVEVHGPVEQGVWLSQLGIQERGERLLKSMAKQEDWAGDDSSRKEQEFQMGWRRLVEGGPKGMGKSYKVMAILPEGGGKRRPVGFGGGVVG